MKIFHDCEGYEAIGSILLRRLMLFLTAQGVIHRATIGEIYFEGAEPKKRVDAQIVSAMLEELGVVGNRGER